MPAPEALAENVFYSRRGQGYLSLPGLRSNADMDPAAGFGDDWQERYEQANGAGSSAGIARVAPHFAQDEWPHGREQLRCAYVGNTAPIGQYNAATTDVTAIKCVQPGANMGPPDDLTVVRSFTWDRGRCAFVDDATGEHTDFQTTGVLPNGTDLRDTSRWPAGVMGGCPRAYKLLHQDYVYDPDKPRLANLGDRRNYDPRVRVTSASSRDPTVEYEGGEYTCSPSALWNKVQRDNQPVVGADELTCCQSQYMNPTYGAMCANPLKLRLIDGVYRPPPDECKPWL